jgi:hypothetical protein
VADVIHPEDDAAMPAIRARREPVMNGLLKTGDLFATNQVSPDTELCYRCQLWNFAQWMESI